MTSETWKILGLIVGGAGTIISSVAKIFDEREKSRAEHGGSASAKLNKRPLYVSIVAFCIAVIGFVIGFGTELASQRKAVNSAVQQAEATQRTLNELTRVMTRLSTISMQVKMVIPLDAPELVDYRHTLEKTINGLIKDGIEAGERRDKVLVLTSTSGTPEIFRFDFDYMASHTGRNWNWGNRYLNSCVPHIVIFKIPIDLKHFYINDFDISPSDFQPIPTSGNGELTVVKSRSEQSEVDYLGGAELEYKRITMPLENWLLSGRILSLKDLEGAQMVIYCPQKILGNRELRQIWDRVRLTSVTLTINNQIVPLDMKKCEVSHTQNGTIYSYILPQLVRF